MKLSPIVFGIVGLVILAGIIIPTGGCGPSKETSRTRVEMSQAQVSLYLYNQEYGQLPEETDNPMIVQILEGDNPRRLKFYTADRKRSKTGEFIDGWGMPLLFKPNDTGILIRSAGKDRLYYTKDDLTIEATTRASPPKGSNSASP